MSFQVRPAIDLRLTCASATLRLIAFLAVLALSLSGSAAHAQGTTVQTSTSMTITSKGASVTSVAGGTAVTLTATVITSANAPVTAGTVHFCIAAAKSCTDVNLIGTAPLNTSGEATFLFTPPPGNHSYQAIFIGSGVDSGTGSKDAPSTSSAESLAVTAATTTALTQTGTLGDYTLTATVSGAGATGVPTGKVSFEDTSNSNAVVATATLGGGKTSALT